MNKRVTLTLSDKLYHKLKEEQEEQGYSNIQEVILMAIRTHYFTHTSSTSSTGVKRGRPKEGKLTDIMSRKHIFSKRGKGPTWKW